MEKLDNDYNDHNYQAHSEMNRDSDIKVKEKGQREAEMALARRFLEIYPALFESRSDKKNKQSRA